MEWLESRAVRPRQARYQAELRPDMKCSTHSRALPYVTPNRYHYWSEPLNWHTSSMRSRCSLVDNLGEDTVLPVECQSEPAEIAPRMSATRKLAGILGSETMHGRYSDVQRMSSSRQSQYRRDSFFRAAGATHEALIASSTNR
jgi:hypothetical protein